VSVKIDIEDRVVDANVFSGNSRRLNVAGREIG